MYIHIRVFRQSVGVWKENKLLWSHDQWQVSAVGRRPFRSGPPAVSMGLWESEEPGEWGGGIEEHKTSKEEAESKC